MFWFICCLSIVAIAFIGAAVETVFENNDILREMQSWDRYERYVKQYREEKP